MESEAEQRERLPLPPYPAQFESPGEFGRVGMQWGSGRASALRRMNELTREALESMGMTLETCEGWEAFYINEALRKPQNPSAQARATLMRRAAELLRDLP